MFKFDLVRHSKRPGSASGDATCEARVKRHKAARTHKWQVTTFTRSEGVGVPGNLNVYTAVSTAGLKATLSLHFCVAVQIHQVDMHLVVSMCTRLRVALLVTQDRDVHIRLLEVLLLVLSELDLRGRCSTPIHQYHT